MSGSLLATYILPNYANASEIADTINVELPSLSEQEYILMEELEYTEIELDNTTVELSTEFDTLNKRVSVTAVDSLTGTVDVIMYNQETGEVFENDVLVGAISTEYEAADTGGISLMATDTFRGTFKINYDVSPKSVATAVSLVYGAITATAIFMASGVNAASIKAAALNMSTALGLENLFPGNPSVNGYFQYSQYQKQVSSGYQYQNRSRKHYMRLNKGSYRVHTFSDSAWFTGTRPY